MNSLNTEEKKLMEELLHKFKKSNERNQELWKALHVIDEQCEKLVVCCFLIFF